MTALTSCDFLHCDAEKPLIVMFYHEDRNWGLCPFHYRLVTHNGASVEVEGGKDYLFSPTMMRGKSD